MTDKDRLKEVLVKHDKYSSELFIDICELFDLNIKTIEERKNSFIELLRPHIELVGNEELNKFYHYWTEISPKGTKMRFEKEKTFEVVKRLNTWLVNKKKFSIVNMLKK